MARLIRTPGLIQQQQQIERAAFADVRRATPQILRALRVLRDEVSLADLEREILAVSKASDADLSPVAKQIRLEANDFGIALRTALDRGLRSGRRISAQHVPASVRDEAARAIARPTVTARATRFAERRAAAEVRRVSATVRQGIRTAIADGVRRGVQPTALAREIKGMIGLDGRRTRAVANFRRAQAAAGVAPAVIERRAAAMANRLLRVRAETIARTETFRAVNEGRRDLWNELVSDGVVDEGDVVRTWVTARDERVDDICEELDGETVGLNDQFSGGFDSPPDPHPDCLPGDALVRAADVRAATVRRYEGDVVVVRTASGEHLTCTPNHPVLTERGWMPARLLYEVGHVLRAGDGERMAAVDHDDDHMPTTMQEVADAFGRARGVSSVEVPVTAPHFHGDGLGSDVAVVRANRFLHHDAVDTMLTQQRSDTTFERARKVRFFARLRTALQLLGRHFASDGSFMGRPHLSLALAAGHARPFQPLGFGLAARFDPALAQPMVDHLPGHAEPPGDAVDRFTGLVQRDQVVGVDVRSFRGHVFNLQTRAGFYLVGRGSIVTHNCRCTLEYRILPAREARRRAA